MQHSVEQQNADRQAVAAHYCPECNRDLKPMNRVAVQVHLDLEFPHRADAEHVDSDYGRRARLLEAYIAERFHEVH